MTKNIKITHREFKTALNKLKYPDSWFWCRYTINPYSGCAHTCIYCDARSERYYLSQDFETEVIVKSNIDKKLDQRFKRSRTLLPDVIGPGGVCDAYQPIESEVENTLKILRVIEKHNYPVNIATKSNLITRDVDILNRIAKDTWCSVGFSITTINEELAHFLEPFSSSPKERLEALKLIKMKAPNVQVGTYFMPIIPYLEDNEENLEAVIKKSKQAGADFILFAPGLTLRDAQAEFFIKKLKESRYNHVVKPILNLYKGQMAPPKNYLHKMHQKLLTLCQKYDIAVRENRWIPNDYRKWNYKISELLLVKDYMDELSLGKSNKSFYWAGLTLNNLEESIIKVYKRGELAKLKNFNSRVREFVEPYLKKSKELNEKVGLDKFL
ncbi:MAG: radical SAM protein [Candidatus Lokiarchaeota archaeon]|nr:radical SAM protein [Candidatus Lokiarchaeota archaeon]